MKQTLQLKVAGQLTLTPQLQQSIKLLQMSTIELNEEIERMLQDNPMLETEEMSDAFPADVAAIPERPNDSISPEETNNNAPEDSPLSDWIDDIPVSRSLTRSDDDEQEDDASSFTAVPLTLTDYLHQQLGEMSLSLRDKELVAVLIDALNEDGYLTQTLDEILETVFIDSDVTFEELQVALQLLQHCDPLGVGARNPAECLMIQLEAQNTGDPAVELAKNIVTDHLALLATRDYTKLRKVLKCDDDKLKGAIELITSLDPRPGAQYSAVSTRYVIPDVIVRKHKGEWTVSLNEEAIPKIKINRLYASMLQASDTKSDNLSGQLQEARWFIRNIRQRFETILRVTQAIIQRQTDFLEHGEVSMRPLVLKEIADQLELHESTISRVTNQKYIQTPRGIYELKYFFGSHVNTESGGHCSSTAIRALIRQLIAEENPKKPLSDSKIAQLLNDQGIVVARRTVAKYRELMQIPPVNQRKTI